MGESRNEGGLKRAVKGIWDGLTDEQKAKAKECKSMDELMTLAGQMGVELPDEMLDAVAGGEVRQYNIDWWSVLDNDGMVYDCYSTQEKAQEVARAKGFSDEVIPPTHEIVDPCA